MDKKPFIEAGMPPQIDIEKIEPFLEGSNQEWPLDSLEKSGNGTEQMDIEKIEPFLEGSNQEWALDSLKKLGNGAEKIALYNYLLKAYTYLMIYD